MLTPDSCVVTHCARDLQQKLHAFWKVILLLWNSNFDKAITNRSEPPKHSKYYQPSFWRELHHCQGRNLLLTSVFFPLFPVEIPGLVCMYGNGDRPGVFYTPMDGKIYSIKLVHITGKVSCRYPTETNWGCDYSNNIQTILTDKENKRSFPRGSHSR